MSGVSRYSLVKISTDLEEGAGVNDQGVGLVPGMPAALSRHVRLSGFSSAPVFTHKIQSGVGRV